MRVLAINIGNTNLQCGVFEDSRLIRDFTFALPELRGFDDSGIVIGDFDKVAVASVSPSGLENFCAASGLKDFFAVNNDNCAGLDLSIYDNPSHLGPDRIAAMAAAWARFPGSDVIVIDAGTAVTVDLVTADRKFKGGYIFPGFKLCLDALGTKTELLPELNSQIEMNEVCSGASTNECILNGAMAGTAGAVRNMVEELKKVSPDAKTIITGGAGKFILSSMPGAEHDYLLTLYGVMLCAT